MTKIISNIFICFNVSSFLQNKNISTGAARLNGLSCHMGDTSVPLWRERLVQKTATWHCLVLKENHKKQDFYHRKKTQGTTNK